MKRKTAESDFYPAFLSIPEDLQKRLACASFNPDIIIQ